MDALDEALKQLGISGAGDVYVPPLEGEALTAELDKARAAGCDAGTLDMIKDLRTGKLVSFNDYNSMTYRAYAKGASLFLECNCRTDLKEDPEAKFIGERQLVEPAVVPTEGQSQIHIGARAFELLLFNFPHSALAELDARREAGEDVIVEVDGFGIPEDTTTPLGLYEFKFHYGEKGREVFEEATTAMEIAIENMQAHYDEAPPRAIHFIVSVRGAGGTGACGVTTMAMPLASAPTSPVCEAGRPACPADGAANGPAANGSAGSE